MSTKGQRFIKELEMLCVKHDVSLIVDNVSEELKVENYDSDWGHLINGVLDRCTDGTEEPTGNES